MTVRHLLQHTAGWDQRLVGDPLMWRGIGKAMGAKDPPDQNTLIKYMMSQPLQFTPGMFQTSMFFQVKLILIHQRYLLLMCMHNVSETMINMDIYNKDILSILFYIAIGINELIC